jgi:hypothetical protein
MAARVCQHHAMITVGRIWSPSVFPVPCQRRGTAQVALAAGILDEIELHVIPVLFGRGRRLLISSGSNEPPR